MAAILLDIFLICTVAAAGLAPHVLPRRLPVTTLAVCALLSAFLIAQLLEPVLLAALQRDSGKIFAGEWWRLVTALFVQDGWVAGGLFNILSLLVIGSLAEIVFAWPSWLAIYGVGAAIAEAVALIWQPVGGGNSVAVCSLAGALLMALPTGKKTVFFLRIAAIAAAFLLLLQRDIHGVAMVAGVMMGIVLSRVPARAG